MKRRLFVFGSSLTVLRMLKGQTLIVPGQLQPGPLPGPSTLQSIGGKNSFQPSVGPTIIPIWATELLTGTLDGTNAIFTCLLVPIPNSQVIYRNGIALFSGAGDFIQSGNTFTFQSGQIPLPGDKLIIHYQHS